MNLEKIKMTLDTMVDGELVPATLNQVIGQLAGEEMGDIINNIKQKVNETNTLSIQAQTQIEAQKVNYGKIIQELRSIGVEPKSLDNELFELCNEIVDITLKMKNTMPDIENIKLMLNNNANNTKDVIDF